MAEVLINWTQADVTALSNAIKSGVRSVDYADRRVTYHSLDEMMQLLDRMVRYVATRGDGQPIRNVKGSVFVSR